MVINLRRAVLYTLFVSYTIRIDAFEKVDDDEIIYQPSFFFYQKGSYFEKELTPA